MKKLILISFFLATSLFSSNINIDFASGNSNSSKKEIKQKKEEQNISYEEIKKYTEKYQQLLGINKKEFKKLMKKYYKEDSSWKKANYYLYKAKKEIELYKKDDIKKFEKNEEIKNKQFIPKWKEALKQFKISCIEHANPISAAQGLDILLINLSMFDNTGKFSSKELNNFFNNYLLVFTKVLTSQEICYGYTGEVLYWFDRKNKLNKTKNIINEGWDICEKQVKENGVPKYLFDTLRFRSAKINAILKIRKAQGKR